MANPQIENGYTKIANELLEAVIKFPMCDYEHRIFWFIVRKTYGYEKREDWISQKQIIKDTGILKQHVSRTVKRLLEKKMIIKSEKKIGIQKDYDLWKLPEQVTNKSNLNRLPKLPIEVTKVTYLGYKSNLNRGTQKKKENIQNKILQKKVKYLDFVYLKEEEHKKLITQLGEDKTKKMMENLNYYIGQIGIKKASKKYVSHYFTILNWVRMEEDKNADGIKTSYKKI